MPKQELMQRFGNSIALRTGGAGRDATWAMLGLFGILFVLSLRPITDPDIWFYLVQGREIVTSGMLPATEFYIFPAEGEPATYSAIGFGIFYYLIHQYGGLPAMAAANALMAAASISLLMLAARRSGPGLNCVESCVIVALLVYLLAEFRFVYRPENLLFVFLGAELVILESWLQDRRSLRLIALIPLVGILSFFHTSAVLLFVVFGCYVVQYGWELVRNRQKNMLCEAFAVAGILTLLILAALLNPNGWEQLLVILRSLIAFNSDLVEYLPALETEYRWNFLIAGFLALLALLFAPRRRPVDWLVVAAFGGVAWIYARNIGLFAVMIAVPLTRTLVHLANRSVKPINPRWLSLFALGLMIFASIWTFRGNRWGTGIAADTVFSNSVVMIRQASESGNVMNFFHHGGYLAWELGSGHKVAVDGHFVRDSFALEYHDRVMRADLDWKSLVFRYDVKFILTPATLPYSGAFVPLVTVLAGDPEWELVNIESAGLMFARADVAKKWPPVDKAEIWKQAVREVTLLLEAYPDNKVARATRDQAERMAAR